MGRSDPCLFEKNPELSHFLELNAPNFATTLGVAAPRPWFRTYTI